MQTINGTFEWQPLSEAPTTIKEYNEIAVVYPQNLSALFNSLASQERVFLYYLFRASLPGNRILANQLHRDALQICSIFETILENKDLLCAKSFDFDINKLINEVTTYLVYHWTNHSQYFLREHTDHKRTPERLGLKTITKNNILKILTLLGYKDAKQTVDKLEKSIFDHTVEPTLTVSGSIEESAVNFYSPDFTESYFKQLDPALQTQVNSYLFLKDEVPKALIYEMYGKYDKELTIAHYWLGKALRHAEKYPDQFDIHVVNSILYLLYFIETGAENSFKRHSIEWLKSNSRIDYCWGFIESYQDPKSYRGTFQAEVTIKSMDIQRLNALLPEIEAQLPFPDEFKRKNLHDLSAMPNASINTKVFAMGYLGPANITLAYALPNYAEIRAEYGTKQIIYEPEKSLGQLINPKLYQQLFYLNEQDEWLKQHDPDGKLRRDIFQLHVILHETLGHGSGCSSTHTFKEDETLIIEGTTYAIGDTIPVTSSNIQQFLAGYDQTIEELRAEIIALYSSINFFDTFANSGFFGKWPEKIAKKNIIEWCILDIGYFGLNRLLYQPDNAMQMSGDHARAFTTILNWITDHGGIGLVEEQKTINGKTHTVIGIKVLDIAHAKNAIKELAILVQAIKSTGDGLGAKQLIDTYGKPIRHPKHIKIIKSNQQAVIGNLKISASLFPHFEPVVDKDGSIVDINAAWPKDIVEQNKEWKRLALSRH